MRLRRGVPVFWLDEGVTQVGLAAPLVFTGLAAADQAALAALEGSGLPGRRLAAMKGLSAQGRAAVRRLAVAGCMEGTAPSPTRPLTVAIHGLGALGLAAAVTLARLGYALELDDPASISREPRGTYGARPAAQTCEAAAAALVRSLHPGAQARTGVGSPGLAIVIGVGAADPALWVPLLREDIPHLLVSTDEYGAEVGPMVLPGHTACGTCLGSWRTEADPHWPLVAVQASSGRRPMVKADVAALAGAFTAAVVDDVWRAAGTLGRNTVWRFESREAPERRKVPPHPECGCGASGFPKAA